MRHYTSMSLVPLEGGFQAAHRLSAIVSKVGTHPQQPMDVRPPIGSSRAEYEGARAAIRGQDVEYPVEGMSSGVLCERCIMQFVAQAVPRGGARHGSVGFLPVRPP